MYRFYITIALLLTATIANHVFSAPEAELTRRPLTDFPKVIGDWRAINEEKIGEGSMAVLQVDDYIMQATLTGKGKQLAFISGILRFSEKGRVCIPPANACLARAGK